MLRKEEIRRRHERLTNGVNAMKVKKFTPHSKHIRSLYLLPLSYLPLSWHVVSPRWRCLVPDPLFHGPVVRRPASSLLARFPEPRPLLFPWGAQPSCSVVRGGLPPSSGLVPKRFQSLTSFPHPATGQGLSRSGHDHGLWCVEGVRAPATRDGSKGAKEATAHLVRRVAPPDGRKRPGKPGARDRGAGGAGRRIHEKQVDVERQRCGPGCTAQAALVLDASA